MSEKLKKYILISEELFNAPEGLFFQSVGYDLHIAFVQGIDYDFIVNDIYPEVLSFPRLQIKDDMNPTLLPLVRSYIHKDLFISTKGKRMLSSYFTDGDDIDLVDRFSNEFKQVFNIKLHDYLNMGFFIDSIVIEAYKGKFDISALRNYLNTLLFFAFKKMEGTKEQMPLDISYSHDGEAFTVQVTVSSVESFKGIEELKPVFEVLTERANFLDTAYFPKRQKLIFSCLFFNDVKLKSSKSFFFTEMAQRLKIQSPKEDAEIVSGLLAKEPPKYTPPKEEDFQGRKLAVARKFTVFIKHYRLNEKDPMPLENIDVSHVETYLSFYPRQEAVTEADDEVKSFICKLLKDEQINKGITEYVQKVAGTNMDVHVPEFQRILGQKSLGDIEEIITIHGSKDSKEDVNRVKGWLESNDSETVVSGDSGMSDDDLWALKKSQLNIKIEDEVKRISSQGRNLLQEDIVKVVAEQLSANEDDIKTVVNGIIEEAISGELVRKQKLEDAFALKLLATQSADSVREKLETQMLRMKKVMEQMKHELIKLQNEKATHNFENPENSESGEVLQLKAALARALDVVKSKDRLQEKQKSDHEHISRAKDMKIFQLEAKIEEARVEFARSREFANEEKLMMLESDNKSLSARLELANKKVITMSGNMENRESEINDKRDKELETLRANMQMAQSVIERFKQDKLDMEQKMLEDGVKRGRDNSSGGISRTEIEERDNHINLLVNEKKILEEKYKVQSIELKKIEQKLKFSTSQLESSQKKLAAGTPGQKNVESYIKQVEQVTSRYKDATTEIAEKRKEVVKLKLENTLMQSKVAELEKKLAMTDKKAS